MKDSPVANGLTVIGTVESPITVQTDQGWGSIISRVLLLPEFRPGLAGLEGFSHGIIVTWLHQANFVAEQHLRRRPRGLESLPEIGIFAQRSKDRPNPIGISVVALLEIRPDAIVVRGLDAVDGTPVVDIKPYVPQFDRPDSVLVPAWVNELMRGYFD